MSASDKASDVLHFYSQLLRQPLAPPDIDGSPLTEDLPPRDAGHSHALLFSPHPDDECLTGALPFRLRQELGWGVTNVAVSLGSDVGQRQRRKNELSKACAVLRFSCVLSSVEGYSSVTRRARADDPNAWILKVRHMARILNHYRPRVIFFPHCDDAHPAHQGTHDLMMDALSSMPDAFTCSVVQTEYWQPCAEPNLMIEANEKDAAKLLEALACHQGENSRNPFDRCFPAYLIDNVRRGTERVGGPGAACAPIDFAMLYTYGVWKNRKLFPSALKRVFLSTDTLAELF